jgi:hypothetical protein
MKYYKRGYLLFVEQLLRDYPTRREELRELEAIIEAQCRGSGLPSAAESRTETSEPERLLEAKERHWHYQWLVKWVGRIEKALSSLTCEEQRLIELTMWEDIPRWIAADELHVVPKTLWKRQKYILAKLVPLVLNDWARK